MGWLKRKKRTPKKEVKKMWNKFLFQDREVSFIRKSLEVLQFIQYNPHIDFKEVILQFDLMYYTQESPVCSFYYYENAYGRHKCSDCPLTHCIRNDGLLNHLECYRASSVKMMLRESIRIEFLLKKRIYDIKKEYFQFYRPSIISRQRKYVSMELI